MKNLTAVQKSKKIAKLLLPQKFIVYSLLNCYKLHKTVQLEDIRLA